MTNYLEKQEQYWNSHAANWSWDNRNEVVGWYDDHNNFEDYETILFWNNGEPLFGPDKVALEYGCGPGRNQIKFHDKFARIDGVDISHINIEKAKEFTKSRLTEKLPEFYTCDGKSIPLPDNSYDVVFAVISLQHINSYPVRFSIFTDIHRVLKSGGWFTAQMGYGTSHPYGWDYYHVPPTTVHHEYNQVCGGDVQISDPKQLEGDLIDKIGFTNFTYDIRDPNHDLHEKWIWFKAQKI